MASGNQTRGDILLKFTANWGISVHFSETIEKSKCPTFLQEIPFNLHFCHYIRKFEIMIGAKPVGIFYHCFTYVRTTSETFNLCWNFEVPNLWTKAVYLPHSALFQNPFFYIFLWLTFVRSFKFRNAMLFKKDKCKIFKTDVAYIFLQLHHKSNKNTTATATHILNI